MDYAVDAGGPVGDGATNPSIWLTQSQPAAGVDKLAMLAYDWEFEETQLFVTDHVP